MLSFFSGECLTTLESNGLVVNLSRRVPVSSNSKTVRSKFTIASFLPFADHFIATTLAASFLIQVNHKVKYIVL